MRCSNCGKRIKKKSSFCMACGAKVPRMPKTEKKKDKKKKRSIIKTAASMIAALVVVFLLFSIFGDDLVPEKVRNLKAYSYVTGMVRERVPDEINLPFGLQIKLPVDLPFDPLFASSFKLPFDLPVPGFLTGDGGDPADKKSKEDPAAHKENAPEHGDEAGAGNEEAPKDLDTAESNGGGESEKTVERSEKEIEFITAGADNSIVLSDYNIYDDIPADWIRSDVKIMEHRTDVNAGTDTVTIYLELENNYVNLTGTKEITYRYNEKTGDWDAGPASKISCLYVEPVTANL